jgi:hypothetical protein
VVCFIGCLDALSHMIDPAGGPGATYRGWLYRPMLGGCSGGLLVGVAALALTLAAGRFRRGLTVRLSVATSVAAAAAVTWGVVATVHRREIGPHLVQTLQQLRPPSGLALVSGPSLTTDEGNAARTASAVPEAQARWHAGASRSACQALAISFSSAYGWTATPGVCGWHRTHGDITTRVYVIPLNLSHAGDVSVTAVPSVMGFFT